MFSFVKEAISTAQSSDVERIKFSKDGGQDLIADLHIHSDASDGTFSPSQIIEIAKNLNIKAIAITDHDTIKGSKEVIENKLLSDIKFLTGVEISASPPLSFPCSGSFHLLGYGIKLDNPGLNKGLEVFQSARKNRNPLIIKKLNDLGMDVSIDEIKEIFTENSVYSGEVQIGRPHIARLLIKKGFVSSVNEAFDKYLAKGKPAYVDKYRSDCRQAIEMIRNADGVPVLAHPGLLNPVNNQNIENLIHILKDMGLMGIEVYYPEHSEQQTEFYSEIAKRYNLLITGGTDFHGSLKPDIQLGTGKGNFFVPYSVYEKLAELCKIL